MEFISEAEFLRRNDLRVNERIRKLIFCFIFVGPFLAVGKLLGIFDTEYSVCAKVIVLAIVTYVVFSYLIDQEKYYRNAKYFGLIAIQISIGIMAADNTIGIHISFAIIPLLSCMYINCRFTRHICLITYPIIILSLYIRSFGETLYNYPDLSSWQWFTTIGLDYLIEISFVALAACATTNYLYIVLKESYNIGKENYYNEEARKVKNAFLANISEELKAPIDELSELSETLLKENHMSEDNKQQVAHIIKKKEMLYTFLTDIEDFSKLQLAGMEIKEEKYHFIELIQDIEETIKSRIGDKNIDLSVVVNPSIPDELYGDRAHIRQILINLLNNTVKYMEDGFIILRIDWKRKDELAILNIEVMDTGNGIEEEDINKLFDSFCKLESNDNQQMDGVGLGLPICKKLCELMNGKISVKNDYGQGSLFTITLPQKIA